jgi:hypothetical protein
VITISAEPADLDIEVFQGAYWSQAILWKDSSDVPVPLGGYTARMQVRRHVDAEDVLLELTTGNGRITLGPGDGEILLEIEAAATADLPATQFDRKWRYDLEMVPAGGQVRRLAMGKFVVSLEVTR